MNHCCRVFATMVVAFLLCLSTARAGSAQFPFNTLKANTSVENRVEFNLLEKIALKKAQQKWGPVAPGPVFPACDDDGDLVAYIFTFAMGVKAFPAFSAIQQSIIEGRAVTEKGLDALEETARQKLLDDAEKTLKARYLGAPQEGPRPNPRGLAHEKAKKLGREQMIGAGQYGTIVVSARSDRFPVPLYMHYLPPFLYQGDLAEGKAAVALSADSATPERIYFLERKRAMYMEYSAKGENVLLHANHLVVEPPEKVLDGKGKKKAPEPEVQARLNGEWDKIKREIE